MIAMFSKVMPRSLFLLVLVFIGHLPLFAQIAVGQWRDHLPYNQGVKLADAGDWVFSASQSGLFQHHKTNGDIVRLSKVSGLSDIGFSSIAWSDENNTLIIAYSNTNIDLLQDGNIINVPDIKNKSILGLKTINNIHVDGDYAYLACGFGIVVLDIVKHEVKDTYYIGSQGQPLEIFDVATTEDEIIACTETGVYQASLSSPNLANFENWSLVPELGVNEFWNCAFFSNRVYVSRRLENTSDTIYYREGNSWNVFTELIEPTINSLEPCGDLLVITTGSSVTEFNSDHQRGRLAYDYGFGYAFPKHGIVDEQEIMWIADGFSGLIRHDKYLNFDAVRVNGPSSVSNTCISIWDGRCYVASGALSNTWGPRFIPDGIYSFLDERWENHPSGKFPETAGASDFIRVLVDPFDSKRVYASTWGSGVMEYYDNEAVVRYDTINSSLDDMSAAPGVIRACGLAIDRNTGTLWVSVTEADQLLHAKDIQGNWYGFNVSGVGSITMGDIAIDNSGQKWIVAPRGTGLVVYNDGGTLSNTNDDQSRRLTQGAGNGNLASSNIYSIAVDFDGEVWVGTDNGISVFYSPESVFSGGNFDSQQILVEQDGYVQYLLENESVTAIEVDGANRKWIGTASAGVFLMSEDGTEEIYHFTKDNSPLFSNQITSLGVDHLSGEVFIGTDKGIISFRGTATWGVDEIVKEEVYAYPNPVEPDYDGPIAIKGLVRDADVKIADASGRVVYATTANGGQAIWDGNNLNGERAQSGVYMVFATNEDGKQTVVTKVLFIN